MKPITEEGVKALLVAHDIDYKIVDNELNSFSIKQLIAKNFDLAKSLGIKGAPSYVVNGIFIPGLIDKERFTAIIGEVRQIAAQTQNTEKTGINNDLTAPEDQKSEDPKQKEESEKIAK
jgi:thioredoxin-related protein